MPTKRQRQYHIERHHFFMIFWLATALLYGGRSLVKAWFAPETPKQAVVAKETKTEKEKPKESIKAPEKEAPKKMQAADQPPKSIALPDSIEEARRIVDELFHCPRKVITFQDRKNVPLRKKTRKIDVEEVFNDLNDVQLATASLIGAPECETREHINTSGTRYVYIGASPFYDIEELTYSVPYLVPRAAILLDEIGHAFLDSLTSKGIPFHKLVVTSVLRTNEDVAKLTRRNRNATEQSCHRYGTTFDIAYSTYYRVSDPDGEKQTEWSAKELTPILAEVLEDQRKLGTCYIKYETRKRCFHITCR